MLDHKGFDLWADGYDKDVELSEESGAYPFAAYRDVLGAVYSIVMHKEGSVLDIGFGTGVLTQKLYDNGYEISGVDFSGRMIEIATEKMPNASFLQWDFTRGLPEAILGPFDWIISTYAIHHLTDEQKKMFIPELLQRLGPDGAIIFGDVAFQNRRELELAREKDRELWDDEEEYLVADEIGRLFPDLRIDFLKKSYCSGVLVIRKQGI